MNILFICHNTPYPPNKGEKIRAFHIIRHFSAQHRVHLLSLAKDPRDKVYEKELRELCASVQIFPLGSLSKKIFAILSLLTPYPLTFGYFYKPCVKKALNKVIEKENIDLIFAFCSSSAQYAMAVKGPLKVIDFIDVDSEKWREYSEVNGFPKSLVFRLEHIQLQRWENEIANRADLSVVITDLERERLEAISPQNQKRIKVVKAGIDLKYFSPVKGVVGPPTLLFVGQMDYLPNIDAVVFFSLHVLPLIKEKIPNVEFLIVGRNPDPKLYESCKGAVITGEVEDIREYLSRATVFVAPMRIAFGAQNKVLEAMASAIPVVTTSKIQRSLNVEAGVELEVADTREEFAEKVVTLLKNDQMRKMLAENAERFVKREHSWKKILDDLEQNISDLPRIQRC